MIFDRFSRGESPDNATHGGTGLGLSISKGLVELMGGAIGVESEEGKGAVFYFTIPHRISGEATKNEKDREMDEEADRMPRRQVLVVEDDEVNAFFLSELLKDLGLEEDRFLIHHVYRGEEAISFCREHPALELVLMDIKLPDIDGMEVTRAIKDEMPRLPVVAQTAHALQSEKEKAGEIGFDGYLSKPIERDDLSEILRRLLKI